MSIIGWDIGGAHLKAGWGENKVLRHVQAVPCPLWQGMDRLQQAVDHILADLGAIASGARASLGTIERHHVTMSGEMCDLFPTRAAGVRDISRWMEQRFPDTPVLFHAAGKGMVPPPTCRRHWNHVASANWQLPALVLRRLLDSHESALFLDIGSTTSDIIPVDSGVTLPGWDDFERLKHRWLHYSGVIRTPLHAVTSHLRYGKDDVPIMAENFAEMADVYRVLGRLDKSNDLLPSADGRSKSRNASLRRLGRMIGLDHPDPILLTQAAATLAQDQCAQMVGIIRRYQDGGLEPRIMEPQIKEPRMRRRIIGAGCGRFLARDIATALNCPYVDFGTYIAQHFPAPIPPIANHVADHASITNHAPAASLVILDFLDE